MDTPRASGGTARRVTDSGQRGKPLVFDRRVRVPSPPVEVAYLITASQWSKVKKLIRAAVQRRNRLLSWGPSVLTLALSAGLALLSAYLAPARAVAPLAALWTVFITLSLLGTYLLLEDRHQNEDAAADAARLDETVVEMEQAWGVASADDPSLPIRTKAKDRTSTVARSGHLRNEAP